MSDETDEKPFNFTKAQLKELADYAGSGVSEWSLCTIFDCSEERFRELLETDRAVQRAVYGGRAVANAEVARALKNNALQGDARSQQFFLKNRDRGGPQAGWSDKSPEERELDHKMMNQPKLVIALTQDDD